MTYRGRKTIKFGKTGSRHSIYFRVRHATPNDLANLFPTINHAPAPITHVSLLSVASGVLSPFLGFLEHPRDLLQSSLDIMTAQDWPTL